MITNMAWWTHFMPPVCFYTSSIEYLLYLSFYTRSFLIFSGGIERDQQEEKKSLRWILQRFFDYEYCCQKQPSGGVLKIRCFENIQLICRRTPMPKCDFSKVARHGCSSVNSTWVFPCKFAAYFQNYFS